MRLAYEAMIFAMECHKDQKRKYTGNPYTDHLAEVAGIVATIEINEMTTETIIAVSWLHDSIEDCSNYRMKESNDIVPDAIYRKFGYDIYYAVLILSDTENGNRAERKKLSRDRLSKQYGWIQNIKVADLISNTSSIVEHDPKFAKVYLEEKRLLLDVLTRADKRLVDIARKQCEVIL